MRKKLWSFFSIYGKINLVFLFHILYQWKLYFLFPSVRLTSSFCKKQNIYFSTSQKKRIALYYFRLIYVRFYYSLFIGRDFSKVEKTCFNYLSIITPLFDDLIDERNYKAINILRLLEDSHHFDNNEEKLIFHFFEKLVHISPNKRLLFETINKLVLSQQETKNDSGFNDLFNAMEDKGGYSLLIFQSCIDYQWKDEDNRVNFHLGGLIQFYNDIMDMYFDIKNNIKTLPLAIDRAIDIKMLFEKETACFFKSLMNYIDSASYEKINIYLMLVFNGALWHLKSIEDSFPRKYLSEVSNQRKKMVFDVETFSNLFCLVKKTLEQQNSTYYFDAR